MNILKRVLQWKRSIHTYIDISDAVREALTLNKPVIALESTIITHGMPYPVNERTAHAVERIIRQENVVPATIGVIKGRIKVGMNEEEIHTLSRPETNKVKISRRDFPMVLSNNLNGGTTVSSTLLVAKNIGIGVFVTGGIGGVHRDVNDTMDISADLIELSQSPVLVVCSGVKSILDIGRTLEYLETHGVCVATYGDTKEFPAFYTRKSGFKSVYNVSNPRAAAALIFHSKKFTSQSGILLGVPIPEAFSFDDVAMQKAINEALAFAKEKNVFGKAVTPFILDHIYRITNGKSLDSNIALIENNALVGSKIAVELNQLTTKHENFITPKYTISRDSTDESKHHNIVVIGGSMMDIVVHTDEDIPVQKDGRTLNGSMSSTVGGVGRNIADAIGRMQPHDPPFFISAIGKDYWSKFLLESLKHVNSDGVSVSENGSSACSVVLMDRNRDCSLVVADMDIMKSIRPEQIIAHEKMISNSSILVFDGNLSIESMEVLLQLTTKHNIPVWFEPTDLTVAWKPLQIPEVYKIDYISPNIQELRSIVEYVTRNPIKKVTSINFDINLLVSEARDLALTILPRFSNIIITLGKYGLLIVKCESGNPQITFYHPAIVDPVINTSGAGDCLASAYMVAMLQGLSEQQRVSYGLSAAAQSLCTKQTVPSTLRYEPLNKIMLKYIRLPVTGHVLLH